MKEQELYLTIANLKQKEKLPKNFLLQINLAEAKKTVIKIAQILICPLVNNCQPTCDLCKQITLEDKDVFYHLKSEKNIIKSDLITDFLKWTNYFSTGKTNKIYWIEQAEKLNTTSANKILKFLEMKNEDCYGIITTSVPENLLKTLLSRLPIFICDKEKISEQKWIQWIEKFQLDSKDLVVLKMFNSQKYTINETFFIEDYLPTKKLFNFFWNNFLNKNLDILFLEEELFYQHKSIWFFWNFLFYFLSAIKIKEKDFKLFEQDLIKKKIDIQHLWKITENLILQNNLFYKQTKQNLNIKINYLYWAKEISDKYF